MSAPPPSSPDDPPPDPHRSAPMGIGVAGAGGLDLDPDPATMEAMGRHVLARVLDHLGSLERQPACGDVDAEEVCRAIHQAAAPEQGRPLEEILAPYFDDWVGRSFTTPSPGYLAFVPGGGLFSAALAEFLAAATNRYTGVWKAAPVLVQLEADVLSWLARWMGMPASTRGLLTTGGSMANFSGLVAARERLLGKQLPRGVLYTSEQAHLCVAKAARLAGLAADQIRAVPVDEAFRMRVDVLDDLVRADREAGRLPFAVVSSAGTTNTGAVDPLDDVADLCGDAGLWHHVDGAYGAFFHMAPELRGLLPGLSRADSMALDPHKGLFLPYGTGALLVRDGEALRAAHADTAGYLPAPPDAEAFYDPSQYGPELSRDFRGLRVWLPLQLHGEARFREALVEKRHLTLEAAEAVAALPGVVMVAPPQLTLFAFHLTWPGASLAAENEATREMLDAVVARQRVMITGCTVDGRYLARVCVLCFRTLREHVQAGVEDITAATRQVLADRGRPTHDA